MFNQPIINEMMTRTTLEYRAKELQTARRRRLARAARTTRTARAEQKPVRQRFTLARVRHVGRKPA